MLRKRRRRVALLKVAPLAVNRRVIRVQVPVILDRLTPVVVATPAVAETVVEVVGGE